MSGYEKFHRIMSNYYKAEQARSEKCLGDITEIVANGDRDQVTVEAVLERLIEHYSRGQ